VTALEARLAAQERGGAAAAAALAEQGGCLRGLQEAAAASR
jgi:hypothetical protein